LAFDADDRRAVILGDTDPGRRAFLSSLIAGYAGFTATLFLPGPQGHAAELSETIKRIKKSVVAVGTYQRLRQPPAKLLGTGFVVADGRHIVTSAHVIPRELQEKPKENLAIFIRSGDRKAQARTVSVVGTDRAHDVAVLRMSGARLPAVEFGDDEKAEEGLDVAITGFPIGTVLGLRASTTRGIISAITPISLPQVSPQLLDPKMIRQLRDGFSVFQLDVTAFPGNSGSPMYDVRTGSVLGIVNSVFVKDTKERVLQDPSGITYATPIRYARALLKTLNLDR
jgi:S1-C subfamily serine protease